MTLFEECEKIVGMGHIDQTFVEKFKDTLDGDYIIAAPLAKELTRIAYDYATRNEFSHDEACGIALGAAAMYRALTGRTY